MGDSTRFLYLALTAKYLHRIFPDPEVSIWRPDIPNIDCTGPFGITPEYPTHPTVLGLGIGLGLELGLGLGLW